MTLAHRLDLPERKGYVPAAFAITAFALGVQIALVTEAIGPQSYPPAGKATLAWVSGLILGASAILHTPVRRIVEQGREFLDGPTIPRRSVHLAPYYDRETAAEPVSGASERTNGHADPGAAELRARVHSPLSNGPVVAPGEEVDFTIEAEPEHLARELEVTVVTDAPSGTRRSRTGMAGTELTHRETFERPGEFTVQIELDHPNADPVAKTLAGRVATYREEVGRLFELLKDQTARAGLDVGPGSTPREVCRELRQLDTVEPGDLADLAVELEVALYGDEEVDRATYETVHAAIVSTGILDDGRSPEVVR